MSNPFTDMANIMLFMELVLKLIKGGYWSLEIYVVDRIIERSMVFRPMLANSTTKMVITTIEAKPLVAVVYSWSEL